MTTSVPSPAASTFAANALSIEPIGAPLNSIRCHDHASAFVWKARRATSAAVNSTSFAREVSPGFVNAIARDLGMLNSLAQSAFGGEPSCGTNPRTLLRSN
jgi:hypothetical protein